MIVDQYSVAVEAAFVVPRYSKSKFTWFGTVVRLITARAKTLRALGVTKAANGRVLVLVNSGKLSTVAMLTLAVVTSLMVVAPDISIKPSASTPPRLATLPYSRKYGVPTR